MACIFAQKNQDLGQTDHLWGFLLADSKACHTLGSFYNYFSGYFVTGLKSELTKDIVSIK